MSKATSRHAKARTRTKVKGCGTGKTPAGGRGRPTPPARNGARTVCVPVPPASGTWTLKAVDGVIDWQNDN